MDDLTEYAVSELLLARKTVYRVVRSSNNQLEKFISLDLGGHPKPANESQLKTGQRDRLGTLIPDRGRVAFVGMSNVLSLCYSGREV